MHEAVSKCFDKVLAVGSNVPRIETILFPEFQGSAFMFSVTRQETSVSFFFFNFIQCNCFSI